MSIKTQAWQCFGLWHTIWRCLLATLAVKLELGPVQLIRDEGEFNNFSNPFCECMWLLQQAAEACCILSVLTFVYKFDGIGIHRWVFVTSVFDISHHLSYLASSDCGGYVRYLMA